MGRMDPHGAVLSDVVPGRSGRYGFTLLEVLIAILVIDVALLALVAGSATLVRRATELRIRGAALRTATERIHSLAAGPCAAAAGNALGELGLRESWILALPSPSIREISDSVAFPSQGHDGAIVLRTRVTC